MDNYKMIAGEKFKTVYNHKWKKDIYGVVKKEEINGKTVSRIYALTPDEKDREGWRIDYLDVCIWVAASSIVYNSLEQAAKALKDVHEAWRLERTERPWR